MDASFGGWRILNHMHDRQNATVVRFLLREKLANYQSDGAAVVRPDRERCRRNQKSEEKG